jgi:hypothetical protein
VWRGTHDDGFLQTAEISTTDGSITMLYQNEFDNSYCNGAGITRISYDGAVMIGWRGYSATYPMTEGKIATFQIGTDGTISSLDSWNVGTTVGNGYEMTNQVRWQQIGGTDSSIWACLCGETSGSDGHIFTFAVESLNTDPNTRTPSVKMLAPVDAIPRINPDRDDTDGMVYSSGHEPKYTLDNDPDTWWEPSWYVTSKLYYDLGSSVTVDAVVFWLHNYNENYQWDKAWRVSYSTDDSTYTELTIKTFNEYRTSYTPVVVDALDEAVTAQYWRIEFLYFANDPIMDIVPEISCVWFMNDYSLPWKHQRPEKNKILYHNNETIVRSGHHYASPAGIGKQRLIERQFIFTAETDQWENLKGAYDAARGVCLPIVLQSEFNSDEYYAVRFDTPLQESRDEHELWTPNPTLRELGHELVPFTDRTLYKHDGGGSFSVGIWNFTDGAGTDESGRGNDLSTRGVVNTQQYGITEQGYTAWGVDGGSGNAFYLPAADAADLELNGAAFTLEGWIRVEPGTVTDFCRLMYKLESNPTKGLNLVILNGTTYFSGGYTQIRMQVYGASATYGIDFNHYTTQLDDGEWHYFVIFANPAVADAILWWDGLPHTGTNKTSNLNATGSTTAETADFASWPRYPGVHIDALGFHKGGVLQANDLVAERYAGHLEYGPWRR